MLTGCVTSGTKLEHPGLAPIPGDIIACINKIVGKPKGGALSKSDVAELLVEMRKNDVAKTACGRRLITFYNNQNPVKKTTKRK